MKKIVSISVLAFMACQVYGQSETKSVTSKTEPKKESVQKVQMSAPVMKSSSSSSHSNIEVQPKNTGAVQSAKVSPNELEYRMTKSNVAIREEKIVNAKLEEIKRK